MIIIIMKHIPQTRSHTKKTNIDTSLYNFSNLSDISLSLTNTNDSFFSTHSEKTKKNKTKKVKKQQPQEQSFAQLSTWTDFTLEPSVKVENEVKFEEEIETHQYSDIRDLPSEAFLPSNNNDDQEAHDRIKAEISAMVANGLNDSNYYQNQDSHDEHDSHDEPPLIDAQTRQSHDDLRRKMREIDNKVKELLAEKNRLKYILKRQEGNFIEGEDKIVQTKECKCCGKDISKLCFRCEHVYCVMEECPRKKKQVLNARMLMKMKTKKGEQLKQNVSKKVQLAIKREAKKRAEARFLDKEEEEEFIDSDYSQEEELSISMMSEQRNFKKKVPPPPSESSIDASSFQFSLGEITGKSDLFFEQEGEE